MQPQTVSLTAARSSGPLWLVQYGDIGTRKTSRAATAYHFGPVRIYDFDGKAQAALHAIPPEAADLISVTRFVAGTHSITDVWKTIEADKRLFDAGKPPFATLVFDTLTNFYDLISYQVLRINEGKRNSKGQFVRERLMLSDPADKSQPTQYIELMERQDYGALLNIQSETVFRLKALPCNLIINAHVGTQYDDSERIIGKTIGTVGKFGESLAGKLMEVHYLAVNKLTGAPTVRVRSDGVFKANTALPPSEINSDGTLKQFDLSVFGGQVYKLPGEKVAREDNRRIEPAQHQQLS